MKRKLLAASAAACAAVLATGGVASAHSVWNLGGTSDDETYSCITENSVGPNGWRAMAISCYAPLQAHDKMFRAVVYLTSASGTVEIRNGEWRDCGGSVSQPDSWIDNNWLHAHAYLEVVNDTKAGGC